MSEENLTAPHNKSEPTYNQILNSAYNLFTQQGYHATSMRQIAQDANIALGGIYNHFPNKGEIFRQVLFAFHPYHDVLPALEAAPYNSMEDFIQQGIAKAIQALDQRPGFLNLMFIEIVEFKAENMAELFQMLLPRATKIAEAFAVDHHEQIKPIPPLVIVRAIISFIFGFYITDAIVSPFTTSINRQSALHHLIDIFCYGVLTHEEPEPTRLS